MTDTPGLGHNMPPRHEAFAMALEDVRLEAGNFLDGAPIETKDQADAIGLIVSKAKAIKRDADAARKQDKEPHLEAGRQVDASYKPVLETCDTIITAAQRPLTSYLAKLAAEQAERERIAREEAARKAQEAIAAQRAAEGNVEAIEHAKALQRDADVAQRDAKRAGREKATVAGMDRAIGLRTYWTSTVTERRTLLEHIMRNDPEALADWLREYARKAVANGTRWMPGVEITEERKVA